MNAQRPFGGIGGLWGPARTDHQRRVAPRRPRHAPVVAIANTHHEQHFTTQQPRRPESEHPQKPPPCACGQAGSQAAVCGVWRSFAHTNTQLAPPRWINMRPVPSQCEWVGVDVCGCGCVGDGAAARRPGADETRPCDKRQESRISRMTKISELGCQQTPFKQPGAILGS